MVLFMISLGKINNGERAVVPLHLEENDIVHMFFSCKSIFDTV